MKNWVLPTLVLVAAVALEFVPSLAPYRPLQRVGSILIIWGVILEVKYVLRITGNEVYTEAETLVVGKSKSPIKLSEQFKAWRNHAGVVWLILGTGLSGFGDLLQKG